MLDSTLINITNYYYYYYYYYYCIVLYCISLFNKSNKFN